MVKTRGMTLIEVMIALVVTTVGLLGALAMIGSLYSASSDNRHMTEALALAQSKVEEINAWVVTAGVPADGPMPAETVNAYGQTPGPTDFQYTRQVTWKTTTTPALNTRHADVTVSWPSSSGITPHIVSAVVERAVQ
jgi:prepilin-type N-terminal cleavage/methylation domain-containing protein